MYFDIGSNIGNWSLENINFCDKIIAVEAVPETFNILLCNTRDNSNIVAINYAVCDSPNDEIVFYKAEHSTLSTLNIDWLMNNKSRFFGTKHTQINCKTITIDKLIDLYGVPELIKIDTEGGEYECVKSLTQKVNNLCFEWASETNDITFKCIDHLYNLGFKEFYLQHQDNYLFRPDTYYNMDHLKTMINKTTPKIDWGMIWCR